MSCSIYELSKKMSEILPVKRYHHSLGVAYLASSLAMCYGEDSNAAMIAGLLHDVAKYIPDDVILAQCVEYNIPITEIERRNIFLLHGKLGAYYAKYTYKVTSHEILSAIRWHTTGKPAMTFLEKAIFLADYMEPGRTQPTTPKLDVLRTLAFHNIDLTIYHVLENMIRYLNGNKSEIDSASVDARNYYNQYLTI